MGVVLGAIQVLPLCSMSYCEQEGIVQIESESINDQHLIDGAVVHCWGFPSLPCSGEILEGGREGGRGEKRRDEIITYPCSDKCIVRAIGSQKSTNRLGIIHVRIIM